MSCAQAARAAGCSERTFRRWARTLGIEERRRWSVFGVELVYMAADVEAVRRARDPHGAGGSRSPRTAPGTMTGTAGVELVRLGEAAAAIAALPVGEAMAEGRALRQAVDGLRVELVAHRQAVELAARRGRAAAAVAYVLVALGMAAAGAAWWASWSRLAAL